MAERRRNLRVRTQLFVSIEGLLYRTISPTSSWRTTRAWIGRISSPKATRSSRPRSCVTSSAGSA